MPVRSASPTKMSPYGASAKSKKRKLMRNELSLAPLGLPVAVPLDGSNIIYDTPASTSPIKRRLDIAELETKKMLLPYLEKIEYVNEQLRARGIGIPMSFTTQGSAISPTKNQEAGDLVVESLSSRSEKEEPTPPQHFPVVSNVACTSITFETLHQRYHRFCATITTKKSFRRRPLGWLLRFMEEVYDDYYQKYITTQRVASFPLFVRAYLDHSLGLVSLADQDALDLLFNVELNRDNFPSIALFAVFLREIEDEEGVLFYAHCRAVIQATFGLSLKSNEKLLADAVSRKFHSPGAIVLANHPLINDGTQSVHLSKEAVGLAFSCAANLTGPRKHLADYVSRYSMNYQQAVTVDSRGGPEMTQELVSMDEVLARFLQLLRAVPEDIVLKYKYDDDGESFTLLTRLSDTIQRDVEINSSKVALAERVRSLRSLEIECMKLERLPDNSRPDIRTQIFLLKGQIASEARAVSSLQDQLNHTEGHVNAVWSSVLSDAAKAPKVQLSLLDNILARVVDYVATLHHDTQLEKKIKKALDLAAKKRGTSSIKTWSTQLDALQERCAIKIQRYFRQRRAWRRQREVAKADLISRRQQHQKRKAEKELERKRLEALRERDAERHRNRMQEKNRRDEDLQNKIKAKEQAVLKKAALAESERRCAKANKELVRRVWSRWQRYVVVCRRTKLGKRMALMYRFRQWRECISKTNAVNGAATMIQAGES
ncbi:hypothetical protein AC1031_021450 [Aphanomyces cochlioides]|nr:hypothetical protein AC1031_021450 [Aphanomyces cochlioides]